MERLGTVAIIGVGLIGGSIGLALRRRGLASRVVGLGRNPRSLAEAQRLGAIDEGTTDPAAGLAGAEVVVVCTPVTRIVEDIHRAAEHGPDALLITDAGSTKRRIVEGAEALPRARGMFVGGHPIAGSERQGVAHARADLFAGRPCVLTPTPRSDPDRVRRARGFWESLGCRIFVLDPEAHDAALALTSHLPHLAAVALAAAVPADLLGLAAGSYRDGTRVAGADPDLWAGILCENRQPILTALDTFQAQLAAGRRALEAGDPEALRRWWEPARAVRSQFREGNSAESTGPTDPIGG